MGLAIIVKGVSFADADLGSVTLSGNRPIEALSIVGDSSVIGSATYRVNLYPANTTQRGIVWSIDSGGAYATINPNTGELFAIEGADEDTVVIRATSSSDNTIYATKTLTVSFSSALIVPLSYIAADGKCGVLTGYTIDDSVTIIADCKIPQITLTTSDRQFVYSDGGNVSLSYSTRWNMYAINFTGYNTKSVTSFFNRGLVTSSKTGCTLYDKTNGNYVTLSSGTVSSGTYGEIQLFGKNDSTPYKKTIIYEFQIQKGGVDVLHLKPVLYNGTPCFYDTVSNNYIYLSLWSDWHVWYATESDPNTELEYTE